MDTTQKLCDLTAAGDRPTLAFEFLGRTPPPGRHWRFTLPSLEALHREGRIVCRPGGTPRLLRTATRAGAAGGPEVFGAGRG